MSLIVVLVVAVVVPVISLVVVVVVVVVVYSIPESRVESEKIMWDFVSGLPRTSSGYDSHLGLLSPFARVEVGDSQLHWPPILVRETKKRFLQNQNLFLTAKSRQKSYADVRRKPMEFQVGDMVMLKSFPDKLRGIHNTFHVSNLKKCLVDENLVVPLEEIQLDDKLHCIEEPIEIMDREVKQLKQSRIPIVKVRWNSRQGLEYT
ncbi:hypothetical protein Tco_1483619 [Tanacetum coccineum]